MFDVLTMYSTNLHIVSFSRRNLSPAGTQRAEDVMRCLGPQLASQVSIRVFFRKTEMEVLFASVTVFCSIFQRLSACSR